MTTGTNSEHQDEVFVVDTLQAKSIVSGDGSVGVTGIAAAQGGVVANVGGTSSTSANAGGAVNNTGGPPGATGVGGAVNNTGGIGGATSGAGGAVLNTGGAATASNSAGGASKNIGGAGSGSSAGGEASLTGGVAGATGAGGVAKIVGGIGGATSGDGGAAQVTGGAATAGNGNGGSVVLTPGAKNGTGIAGGVRVEGVLIRTQAAPTAKTVSATLTAAELLAGIVTVNQGGGAVSALQLPTGTAIVAAMPADFATGDSFDVSFMNISTVDAEDASVTTNTDLTLVGSMDFPAHSGITLCSCGILRFRKTGATTLSVYRVA